MLLVLLVLAAGIADALNLPETHARKQYQGYKVLSAIPINEQQLADLKYLAASDSTLDFWLEPSTVHSEVHVMVPPEHLARVEATLKSANIDYKTHIDNVQDQLNAMWHDIDSRAGKQAFNIDDFNTLDDIYSWLDSLVGNCRAGLTCEVYTTGYSYQNRPIQAFKISKSGANRKAYWIDATIHAREWIATATTLKILNHLAVGGDANAIALTDEYDWYVVPVVNPDGYAYSWTNDRLWRKNRSPNSGSTCIGTDLNRNFGYTWGKDGVSFSPCNDLYCGASAGSEPEVRVVSNELTRLAPTILAVITVHSYGNYWLFSWGTTVNFAGSVCDRTPDHAELQVVADITANAIQATYNTRWARGNSCETIYPTSGSTQDYAKGALNIKYSFTAELRGNSFIISNTNIPLSFNEVWNGIVAFNGAISS